MRAGEEGGVSSTVAAATASSSSSNPPFLKDFLIIHDGIKMHIMLDELV